MKPVVLCILDGCGIKRTNYGNAFKQAKKPNFDALVKKYPHSLLEASGEAVGLPKGQMGTSEVGHLTLGAGRLILQPLPYISEKIKTGEFFTNENILEVINHVKKHKSKLHIFGLMSNGGVHSHMDHLMALLDMCKQENIENLYLHMFTDGRDTPTKDSKKYFQMLERKLKEIKIGSIATISGRFWAMDRDNRWDRIERAYKTIALGKGKHFKNYKEVLKYNYDKNITDEFITPAVLDKKGIVEDNDGIIIINFRSDRLREISSAFTSPKFKKFEREKIRNIKLCTMMKISGDAVYKPAFEPDEPINILGEYISKLGLKQLRIAETEKYAHVTYFFDDQKKEDLSNCKKVLIPSPKVKTYDMKPEMSAYEVTDALLKELDNDYDMVILNYANGDMVGHTGKMDAAIKAVEVIDECLGKIYEKIESLGGVLIIIADHGNCDTMIDKEGNPVTTHSTALVPCIITKEGLTLSNGSLTDIAPTMLKLMGIKIPKEMTGNVLIK